MGGMAYKTDALKPFWKETGEVRDEEGDLSNYWDPPDRGGSTRIVYKFKHQYDNKTCDVADISLCYLS